jgi:hypothetical protein
LIADLTLENGLLWQPVFLVVVLQFSSAFRLHLARPLTEYLAAISWETEVWVAATPSHLIHFDGERFLGPYDS